MKTDEPREPVEPYYSLILKALLVEVKPWGGVWCDGGGVKIRYAPFGTPMRVKWAEAAVLVGVDVPEMRGKIRKVVLAMEGKGRRERLAAASAATTAVVARKPAQREYCRDAVNGSLSLERIAQAKREAREWQAKQQVEGEREAKVS